MNRIELAGRVAAGPEFRVTPSGTPVLKLSVDCGAKSGEKLRLDVILTGDSAQHVSVRIRRGSEVSVFGRLRAVPTRGVGLNAGAGVEVIADRIETLGENEN